MPELPEVETVRRGLQKLIAGKVIDRVEVRLRRIVRTPGMDEFCQSLRNQTVEGVDRRGKYLLFRLSGATLVSHLRMEGRYSVHESGEVTEPHTHVVFYFTDGTELRYRDVRQFGTMDLVPGQSEDAILAGVRDLGLEPLDPTLDALYLQAKLSSRRAPIKAALLDQSVIAGLGNIYVDEVLFAAKIHPMREAGTLTKAQRVRLIASMRDIIARAIEQGGSSVRTYVNGFGDPGSFQLSLSVYGQEGQPCPVCGQPIVKLRVAGRGTHVCPKCQRLKGAGRLRSAEADGKRGSVIDANRAGRAEVMRQRKAAPAMRRDKVADMEADRR